MFEFFLDIWISFAKLGLVTISFIALVTIIALTFLFLHGANWKEIILGDYDKLPGKIKLWYLGIFVGIVLFLVFA